VRGHHPVVVSCFFVGCNRRMEGNEHGTEIRTLEPFQLVRAQLARNGDIPLLGMVGQQVVC